MPGPKGERGGISQKDFTWKGTHADASMANADWVKSQREEYADLSKHGYDVAHMSPQQLGVLDIAHKHLEKKDTPVDSFDANVLRTAGYDFWSDVSEGGTIDFTEEMVNHIISDAKSKKGLFEKTFE